MSALAAFLQRYPKFRLDIRRVDNMVHPIRNGLDIALGVGPLQDSTRIGRKVFTLECLLCKSPDVVAALLAGNACNATALQIIADNT